MTQIPAKLEEKLIRIRTVKHSGTGLIIGICDDFPGLSIVAKSFDELEKKMPIAVRDFLEASGYKVDSVDLMPDALADLPDFGPRGFVAHASISTMQAA